jgi:hypothetical protein
MVVLVAVESARAVDAVSADCANRGELSVNRHATRKAKKMVTLDSGNRLANEQGITNTRWMRIWQRIYRINGPYLSVR